MPLGLTVTALAKLIGLNVFHEGGSETAISKAGRPPSSKYLLAFKKKKKKKIMHLLWHYIGF